MPAGDGARAPRTWMDRPSRGRRIRADVLLAHGAGAGADHPFLDAVATGLAQRGFAVTRFEFPYMAARRASDGQRRPPPDRFPKLVEAYELALEALLSARPRSATARPVVLAGKSMGGRVAVATAASRAGCPPQPSLTCVFGYPFHAAGKPVAEDRLELVRSCPAPLLIAQGERDPMGPRSEIETLDLGPRAEVHWCPDGDHSLEPRKRSGHTFEANFAESLDRIGRFVTRHVS